MDFGFPRNPMAPELPKYDTGFSQLYIRFTRTEIDILSAMREYFIDVTEILKICLIGGVDCKPSKRYDILFNVENFLFFKFQLLEQCGIQVFMIPLDKQMQMQESGRLKYYRIQNHPGSTFAIL